jgi:hypothetical protein
VNTIFEKKLFVLKMISGKWKRKSSREIRSGEQKKSKLDVFPLLALPNELILHILKFLTMRDVVSVVTF